MTNPPDDFDELLRRAARGYNEPGEVPRDRMWAEIRAGRAQRTPFVHQSWFGARRSWYVPAAAAAVLVLGIAIGRLYERQTVTHHPIAVAPMLTGAIAKLPEANKRPIATSPDAIQAFTGTIGAVSPPFERT